jgi:hypothetical protein
VIGQLFCPAGADGFTTLVISKKDNYLFRQSSLKKVRCAFACPKLLCSPSVSQSVVKEIGTVPFGFQILPAVWHSYVCVSFDY